MASWQLVKRPGLGALALGAAIAASGCTAADFLAIASALESEIPSATGAPASPIPAPSATTTSGNTSTPGVPVTPGPVASAAPVSGSVFRVVPKWTEAQFKGEPEVERLIIKYTNEARAGEGLPPLVEHRALTVSARQHSQEMIEDGYFEHTSPHAAYARPSDRARLAGYMAGCSENIFQFFLVQDPDSLARQLVDGWMKSPGHRANILAESAEIGAGVWRDGKWIMATQVFSSGQAFDFTDITLEDRGGAYVLRAAGKVTRHTRFRQAQVTVDGEGVGPNLTFAPGGDVAFEAAVPKGGRHTVGLDQVDPADIKGGFVSRFWPTELFELDTSKPLAEAVL
ncbi:Cysteine-rich secretory protein family protein [compost metagenome]